MYEILFYTTARGEAPVETFMNEMPPKARGKALGLIDRLSREGPNLRRPQADHVRGKIWELRVSFGGNQYRILYAFAPRQRIVLLHAFAKKTQQIPAGEIELATKRWAEVAPSLEKVEEKS